MSAPVDPIAARRRAQLSEAASALRTLHQHLIGLARLDYERERGPIASPAAFLDLLMGDPYFRWLRALSGAMAELDQLLDRAEVVTAAHARAVRVRFDLLVAGDDPGDDFGVRYRASIQRSPEVAMAHAAVRLALRPLG